MQLTIRGMKRDVEEAIRRIAREERISLNKAVIRLLEKAIGRTGPEREPGVHNDLDRFSGVWSAEEAEEIEELLSDTRTVDEEMWE